MNPGQKPTSRKSANNMASNNNPFARALAETEKRSYGSSTKNMQQAEKQLANNDQSQNFNQQDAAKLQKEKEIEIKKRQMREKLHRKVNPVEQTDIYNAREARVKKELDQVRKELKLLAAEFSKFYKEIDITLETNIAHPGQTGVYHKNFFQKLKAFIILLRQKVRSARTWARQAAAKKKKKKRSAKAKGLDFAGNEAKATHDMLNPERFNAYSGA